MFFCLIFHSQNLQMEYHFSPENIFYYVIYYHCCYHYYIFIQFNSVLLFMVQELKVLVFIDCHHHYHYYHHHRYFNYHNHIFQPYHQSWNHWQYPIQQCSHPIKTQLFIFVFKIRFTFELLLSYPYNRHILLHLILSLQRILNHFLHIIFTCVSNFQYIIAMLYRPF